MKGRAFAAILAVCIMTGISGCGKERAATEDRVGEPFGEEAVQGGGTLYLAMGIPSTLNPLLNTDRTVDDVLKLVFEPLFYLDGAFRPKTDILESYVFDSGGTALTLTVKPGLFWQDGEEITADDIIYSLDTITESGEGAFYRNVPDNISRYTKNGAYSATIYFEQAFSGNLYSLCFPIIPKHYYQGSRDAAMKPLGSGPYKFESYVPAGELVLAKTKDCFGGEGDIERIWVKLNRDEETALYMLENGGIDCAVAGSAGIEDLSSGELSVYEYTTDYYDFAAFNFHNPVLSDVNIRRAIACAVNKESIVETIYLGHAKPAATPVNPASWLYSPATGDYEYDLQKAKDYLTQSGWTAEEGVGIRAKNGEALSLSVMANEENPERMQIANYIAGELRTVGFEIMEEILPFAEYKERLYGGEFDIAVGGWQLSSVPDLSFMFRSGDNFISYGDGEMDRLLYLAYNCHTEAPMLSAYENLQEYIVSQLPYLSIAFRDSALLGTKRLSGTINPVQGHIYNGIKGWRIEEKEN